MILDSVPNRPLYFFPRTVLININRSNRSGLNCSLATLQPEAKKDALSERTKSIHSERPIVVWCSGKGQNYAEDGWKKAANLLKTRIRFFWGWERWRDVKRCEDERSARLSDAWLSESRKPTVGHCLARGRLWRIVHSPFFDLFFATGRSGRKLDPSFWQCHSTSLQCQYHFFPFLPSFGLVLPQAMHPLIIHFLGFKFWLLFSPQNLYLQTLQSAKSVKLETGAYPYLKGETPIPWRFLTLAS